jgi:hypothetical protein
MYEEIANLRTVFFVLGRPEYWDVYAGFASVFVPVFYNEPDNLE